MLSPCVPILNCFPKISQWPFGRCLAPTLFSQRPFGKCLAPTLFSWHLPCSRRRQAPSKRTPPQGETRKRRGHHAARPKGHHSARPRGALIETRTRTPTQRRHHVACPRGAMIRSYTPLSDQHPTGTSPDVMASSLGSHAGYDYRSTGASPVETNNTVRRG